MPDQSAYFAVSVAGNRELLLYLADRLQVEAGTIIKRVDRIAGGVRFAPSAGAPGLSGAPGASGVTGAAGGPEVAGVPDVTLVAAGRLPEGASRFALWRDRGFTREVAMVGDERIVYYRQKDGPVEILPGESGLLFLSTGSVLRLLPAATASPGGPLDPYTASLIRSTGAPGRPDMIMVFNDPRSLLILRGVDLPGFPVTHLTLAAAVGDIGARVQETPVALDGELVLGSVAEAALFGRLGRMVVLGLVRALGLDGVVVREDLEIAVVENRVAFRGITLTVEELTALMGRLVTP